MNTSIHGYILNTNNSIYDILSYINKMHYFNFPTQFKRTKSELDTQAGFIYIKTFIEIYISESSMKKIFYGECGKDIIDFIDKYSIKRSKNFIYLATNYNRQNEIIIKDIISYFEGGILAIDNKFKFIEGKKKNNQTESTKTLTVKNLLIFIEKQQDSKDQFLLKILN